jgi:hypothetical protein
VRGPAAAASLAAMRDAEQTRAPAGVLLLLAAASAAGAHSPHPGRAAAARTAELREANLAAALASRRLRQQQQPPAGPAPEALPDFSECVRHYAQLGLQGILGLLPSCSDDPVTEQSCCGQIRGAVNQPGAAFYLCAWLRPPRLRRALLRRACMPPSVLAKPPATRRPPGAGLCDPQAYELVRNNIGSARLSLPPSLPPITPANFDFWLSRCNVTALSTSGCPAPG